LLVNRDIRKRLRRLVEIDIPPDTSRKLEGVTAQSLRKLDRQHLPPSASPSRLESRPDEQIQEEFERAQRWLAEMLTLHVKILNREHYIRTLRSAIEKELAGAKEKWSDVERLYMALTDANVPDPKQRLGTAVLLVLELNLAERLAEVSKLATQRYEAAQRTASLGKKANDIRSQIVERTREIKIDHFACAIPLATLKQQPDIVDENQGCCPVCQNSYTDLSTNTLPDLLADFPVRIKYCRHVIGKACLEQWMGTPKIDEAKYPHRTCPLCRVKIEGVRSPKYPESLKTHLKTDRRAKETLKEMVYGWDMEMDECLDTIAMCMSEEIACEELLEVVKDRAGKTRWSCEDDKKMLEEKVKKLKEERWVWGFRGDRGWRQMRDEWMTSGMVKKE
jgi:hypothetical protein